MISNLQKTKTNPSFWTCDLLEISQVCTIRHWSKHIDAPVLPLSPERAVHAVYQVLHQNILGCYVKRRHKSYIHFNDLEFNCSFWCQHRVSSLEKSVKPYPSEPAVESIIYSGCLLVLLFGHCEFTTYMLCIQVCLFLTNCIASRLTAVLRARTKVNHWTSPEEFAPLTISCGISAHTLMSSGWSRIGSDLLWR